jgi:hypothetical protein
LVFEVLADAVGGCVVCAKRKPGATAVRIAFCNGVAIRTKRPTVISDPITWRDMKAASKAVAV